MQTKLHDFIAAKCYGDEILAYIAIHEFASQFRRLQTENDTYQSQRQLQKLNWRANMINMVSFQEDLTHLESQLSQLSIEQRSQELSSIYDHHIVKLHSIALESD
ncbi:hypothetical protein NB537_08780 [Vibrio parahaemolyticus]|nr:hypothetical protein [Vibrio parahaemolyticus]MCR9654899.1 hypothetical protein [Vibrio parahaemolyticus]